MSSSLCSAHSYFWADNFSGQFSIPDFDVDVYGNYDNLLNKSETGKLILASLTEMQ